jgi:hypothetical protein
MPTYSEQIETISKQLWLDDTKRASNLGMNVYEYRSQHKAAVEEWTGKLRELMKTNNAYDPATVLPEICVHIVESIREIAKAEAETAARSVVQKMLKRAMTPL